MVSGGQQHPLKRESLNPSSEPLNPIEPVGPVRFRENGLRQFEDRSLASMGEEGEDETFLRESSVLSLEEVIRRRANRVKRLSGIYRKQYWALMEEMRFKYREYHWRFGKSGCKDGEEWENEGGGNGFFPGNENVDYRFPATVKEDEGKFLSAAADGVELGYADRLGQVGGGFQDRGVENGFGFAEMGFPADMEGGFLGKSGDHRFVFPGNGFPSKNECGLVVKSEENQFGYPENGFPSDIGQHGGRFLGENGKTQFGFPDSGFPVNGCVGDGHRFVAKAEENEFGFTESWFPLRRRNEGSGLVGKSSENEYAFMKTPFPGKESQDACGFPSKNGESGFPVKKGQQESLVPGRTGEHCVAYREKADEKVVDSRCGFSGCKVKPMALSCFCHSHILSDAKQKLYKPCTYVIKSGQSGPITCGKPVLRAVVPSLCSMHFQKAQKHLARSLKKAGHSTNISNTTAPKFHVIVAEYVRRIQAKRKYSDTRSRLPNKELPVKVDLS